MERGNSSPSNINFSPDQVESLAAILNEAKGLSNVPGQLANAMAHIQRDMAANKFSNGTIRDLCNTMNGLGSLSRGRGPEAGNAATLQGPLADIVEQVTHASNIDPKLQERADQAVAAARERYAQMDAGKPPVTQPTLPDTGLRRVNTSPDNLAKNADINANMTAVAKLSKQVFGDTPLAHVATTMAVLESRLTQGGSDLAIHDGNLLGIKYSVASDAYSIGSVPRKTNEYNSKGKITIRDEFAKYDSAEDCFKQLNKMMDFPRYANVRNAKTPEEAFAALRKSGYSTDPKYNKLLNDVYKYNVRPVWAALKGDGRETRLAGEPNAPQSNLDPRHSPKPKNSPTNRVPGARPSSTPTMRSPQDIPALPGRKHGRSMRPLNVEIDPKTPLRKASKEAPRMTTTHHHTASLVSRPDAPG